MKEKLKQIPAPFYLAGGMVLLGLLIRFCLIGYSFSAYCCFGAAALIVCFHWLRPVGRRILAAALGAGLLAACITGGFIYKAALGQPEGNFGFLIVLGAGVNGTEPSRSLQDRIDVASDFLSEHEDVVCIVSGGKGDGENLSEALCMYQELTEMGVPAERIWMEDQATSTRENLEFSMALIEEKTGSRPECVGVLSSEYHLFRAGMFAAEQGVECCGIPAKTSHWSLFANYFVREILMVWYYGTIARA